MNFFHLHPVWWKQARNEGLVSGEVPASAYDDEPSAWVIVLAMIGALVCTVPFGMLLVVQMGERFWLENPAAYLVCAMGLAGAALLFRRAEHTFLSCIALVLWSVSQILLILRLIHWVDDMGGSLIIIGTVVAVLQLLCAWMAPTLWVKRLMGVACVFGVSLIWIGVFRRTPLVALRPETYLLALGWIVWCLKEPQWLARPLARPLARASQGHARAGWTAFVEAAALGVLAMECMGDFGGWRWALGSSAGMEGMNWSVMFYLGRILAVVATLASVAVLVHRWRATGALTGSSSALLLSVGVLLGVGSLFSPSLGIVVMIAVGALMGARWRMAILCAVAALWLLGQFYYLLDWTLASKGLGLAIIGAALLLVLYVQRLAARRASTPADAHFEEGGDRLHWSRARTAWLVAGAVLVFGLVNWDVRGKEQVIAHGERVLVPLVPVDPRSLMQGDYMSLRFDIPREVSEQLEAVIAPTALVLADRNAQGHAHVRSLLPGGASAMSRAPNQLVLPLKRLKGRWVLVTDAFFFPEGRGQPFEQAKFGDFRVLPDGRALLVGLADAQGAVIEPAKTAEDKAEVASSADVEAAATAVAPEPDVVPAVPAQEAASQAQ